MAEKMEKVVEDEGVYINIPEGVLGPEEEAELKLPLQKIESSPVLIPKDDSQACLLDFVPHGDLQEAGVGVDHDDASNASVSFEMKGYSFDNNCFTFLRQVVLPFILAGLGTVAAGLVLEGFVSVRFTLIYDLK